MSNLLVPSSAPRQWTNFARIGSCSPQYHHHPSSTSHVVRLIRAIRTSGGKCRFAGEGKSPNASTFTCSHLIHMDKMDAVLNIDPLSETITCQGGVRLEKMLNELDAHDLMLRCVPSFVKTTIAGCLGTATHSSGAQTNSLCDYVTRMVIVDGTGHVHSLDIATDPSLLRLAACHLGLLGAVVEVTLQAERRSLWHLHSRPLVLAEAMDAEMMAKKVAQSEYYRFWWVPHTRTCFESFGSRVPKESKSDCAEAVGLAAQGGCAQWKSRFATISSRLRKRVLDSWVRHSVVQRSLILSCRFPSLQPAINRAYSRTFYGSAEDMYGSTLQCFTFDCLFTQWANEWAIDASRAVEAFQLLQNLIDGEKLRVHFPVEFRFSAADVTVMSPAAGRPTCWIGIVMYRPLLHEAPDTRRYYDGFCDIMTRLGGRPHWGKYYCWSKNDVQKAYGDGWLRFQDLRHRMDPDNIFVNGWAQGLLSDKACNSTHSLPSHL